MKKVLSLLLVLVMLLSLSACGKDDAQNTDPSTNPGQVTTDNTEGTTGVTQAPTDETTVAPTTEPTTAPSGQPTTPSAEQPTTKPTTPSVEQPTTKPAETPTTPPATSPATCSHSYKDATCTAPKTCSKCGATSGSALGHSYKDATCTAPKTCSKCSATSGNALGHSYKDATCTAPKTCSKCSATSGSALGHSYKDATCTAPKTCSKCSTTEGGVSGHIYDNGICRGCGDVETITHPFGTGVGYAITQSPSGTAITCYQISASELLCAYYSTEKPANGYYIFREYNAVTYYTPAPSWGWNSINSHTISGKTVQLNVGPETMVLELISANQYKVTKGVESIPAGIVFTFGADMCSFMGHLYERSCENDVNCLNCGLFKCAGLGHEYGGDGVCFRCFAAMRPSE